MANWKTYPVFSAIASSFGEREFFLTTFTRFYTSIYAAFRVHEKSGKPHFRFSFIIAGFHTFCQNSNGFPIYIFCLILFQLIQIRQHHFINRQRRIR